MSQCRKRKVVASTMIKNAQDKGSSGRKVEEEKLFDRKNPRTTFFCTPSTSILQCGHTREGDQFLVVPDRWINILGNLINKNSEQRYTLTHESLKSDFPSLPCYVIDASVKAALEQFHKL